MSAASSHIYSRGAVCVYSSVLRSGCIINFHLTKNHGRPSAGVLYRCIMVGEPNFVCACGGEKRACANSFGSFNYRRWTTLMSGAIERLVRYTHIRVSGRWVPLFGRIIGCNVTLIGINGNVVYLLYIFEHLSPCTSESHLNPVNSGRARAANANVPWTHLKCLSVCNSCQNYMRLIFMVV